MKVSAMSLTKLIPSTVDCGISPSAPGPMSRPAMMKPLTLGSRSSFVTRVTRNPANNIMERETSVTAAAFIPS